jgi:hypothetical protein
MTLKLKRIAPLQAGKLLGACYGLISLVFVPFMMIFMALGSFAAKAQASAGGTPPPLPLMLGMGVGFTLLLPILYAVIGFIFGLIAAFVYNLLARWLGGFELEFESSQPPPPLAARPIQP